MRQSRDKVEQTPSLLLSRLGTVSCGAFSKSSMLDQATFLGQIRRNKTMPKPRLVRLAESWAPDPDDPLGEDKQRLIDYLLENEVGSANPKKIDEILRKAGFTRRYRREAFQHQLLGPL